LFAADGCCPERQPLELVADALSVTALTTLVFDLADAALAAGLVWDQSVVAVGGGRQALRLPVVKASIPEPGALA